MIRALGKGADGRPLMLLGITQKNIDYLKEGQPMVFDASALGFAGTVVIIAGETEKNIADYLSAIGVQLPQDVDLEPLPPIKHEDPDYPYPYVVVELHERGILLRYEKGVPDSLAIYIKQNVAGPMIAQLEPNERTRHLVAEAVYETLNALVQAGDVLRIPMDGERFWTFQEPL